MNTNQTPAGETHCEAWKAETHNDRGPIDCGCGWGAYCELSSEYVGPVDLTAKARELGLAAGYSAGSWYFDGNTDEATYRRVLEGLNDGDPEVLDTIPSSPLSGEWADGPTPHTLAEDMDIEDDDERLDDLCTAYEDAFLEAVQQEIEERAAYMLSDDAKTR